MRSEEVCFQIFEHSWGQIQNLVEVLSVAHQLIVKLQKPELFLSNCFIEWHEALSKLNSIASPIAQSLAEYISYRSDKVLKSKVMLNAVFFDPKIKVILAQNEVEECRRRFKNLSSKIICQIVMNQPQKY